MPMIFRVLAAFVVAGALATLAAGEPREFRLEGLTLPEALDALKQASSEESGLRSTTFFLPRSYHNQGAKVGGDSYRIQDERVLWTLVLEELGRLHRLVPIKDEEKNHYRFIRDPAYRTRQPFTLLEALAAIEKHIVREEVDLKHWALVSAELKFDRSDEGSLHFWHLRWSRSPATDGGVGTHHFFVWDDLVVEHFRDGEPATRKSESSAEIVKRMRPSLP